MSPESYSWEVRESAEELYIIDGRTYEQVAETTGVSTSQLKRWGTEATPSWMDRRREYRQAQTSVRRGVMLAKAKLIESVIETEDAQKAYAFSALVSSAKTLDDEARSRMQLEPQPTDTEPQGEMVTDTTEALTAAIQRKIGTMLSAPNGITLATIKELQGALQLLEKLKARNTATTGIQDRQLDTAAIQALREQFGL
ncbi:MAG: hypothetical protein KJ630_08075 [Proteobacteria bacterium]|nr:hypothetical protein [Pseudomonadota bacterium]